MWLRRSPVIPKFEPLRRSTQCPWMLNSSTSYSDTPIKKTKLAPLHYGFYITGEKNDRFSLWAKGGDGGNVCCSVRRSLAERQGTPDGGSGGRGGDMIIECSPKVRDFRNLQHHTNAKRGGHGAPKSMIGSRGSGAGYMSKSCFVVLVPVGTVIHLVDGEIPSAVENRSLKALDPWEIPGALEVDSSNSDQRTKSHSSHAAEVLNTDDLDTLTSTLKRSDRSLASMCKTSCTSSTEFQTAPSFSKCLPSINKEELISHSEIDNMEGKEEIQYNVAELTKQGQRVLVARGGDGGLGNVSFGKHFKFKSKVSNDEDQPSLSTGLLAYTLLGAISKAKPTVGHYAFTTLRPSIGNLNYDDFFSVTVADIHGILKGAHENRGLGHAFLRHIERTKVLTCWFNMVDLAAALDGKKGIPQWVQLRYLVLELEFHQEGLSDRPSLVGVLEELKIRVPGVPIFPVFAVFGEGVFEIKSVCRKKKGKYPRSLFASMK
ncbi:hypothetical protein MKX01_002938 [Papaver californicum]|nr:hypothetical protein MKX01_002938 [Papaver californicum]